jgi:hypothetical protein
MPVIGSMLFGLAGNQIANDSGGAFMDLADEAVDLLLRQVKGRRSR